MADTAFVAIALAFFALSFLYVLGCDKVIGRDSATTTVTDHAGADPEGRTVSTP